MTISAVELKKKYYIYCLNADMVSAIKLIQSKKFSKDKKIKSFYNKVSERFIKKNEKSSINSDDFFIKTVIQTYRNYYRDSLLNPKNMRALDKKLNRVLTRLCRKENIIVSKNIEFVLKTEFKKRGYKSIFGVVKPFRSLIVWKDESLKTFKVKLPEKKQNVKVIFLDNIIELSWLNYATFEKYYVGGWAEKNVLFCVKKAYNVKSSKFAIHYLAHEAQHFLDYKQFPKLLQPDLEYRAKLVELSLLMNPKKFINKLQSEAKNDFKIPHSFAAYQIVEKLRHSEVQPQLLAQRLLAEHTQLLKLRGAKKVKTAFKD